MCTINKMLYKIKQINKYLFTISFICGLRRMDRGTQQRSAAFKEKFREEVPKLLSASQ